MDLKSFTKLIKGIQAYDKKVHEAYKLGIDVLPFGEDYYKEVVQPLLNETFGPEGVEWIEWYIWGRDLGTGEVSKAWDENGNEICQNISSLYKTVKSLKKVDNLSEFTLEKVN
jgi:hypothetical protein